MIAAPLPASILADLTPGLLAWEAFVTAAMLGFGLSAMRLWRRAQGALGVAACLGIAVWLAIGGWLNLFGVATRPVLRVLLAAGFLLFVSECLRGGLRLARGSRRRWTLLPWLAASLVAAVFALCFVAHLGNFTWNRFDDTQAYLAFADKASTLGGLQPEPFSERRVTSGVGGGIYLDATMLAGAGNVGVDFLEAGFGLLALLLCMGAAVRAFRLSRWSAIFVFAMLAVFTFGRTNLSVVVLSAATFLAILLLMLEESPSLATAALIGLLVGSAATLKSSNIPFCGLLLLVPSLIAAVRVRSWRPLLGVVVAAMAALLAVLPWAIKHRLDEGTALFPSLGRGFHLSAYGFPTISQTVPASLSLFSSLPDLLLPLLALACAYFLLREVPHVARVPVLSFLLAAAVTAPLFAVSIAGEEIDRFLLPIENLCFLLLLMCLLAPAAGTRRARPMLAAGVLACLWISAFIWLALYKNFYRDSTYLGLLFGQHDAPNWYEVELGPAQMAEHTAAVRRAQASVPAGDTLLESVDDAYAFDWKRNPVLIADYPGMASPVPGIPIDAGPDAMRTYLLQHGVRYVMLDRSILHQTDYAEFRWHPQISMPLDAVLLRRQLSGYSRMEYYVSNRTREVLLALAATHPAAYDDGRLLVIPLR